MAKKCRNLYLFLRENSAGVYITLKKLCQLVEVSGRELVEILTGPNREDEDGGAEAGKYADDDGGEALVRHLPSLSL